MKWNRYIPLLKYISAGRARKELLQLLQQQRQLLHTGLQGQAEVIHSEAFNRHIGRMQQVQLWLKLKRADGSYIYTHTSTLVPGSNMPQKGNVLRIRYRPDNFSVVSIM